MKTVTEISAKTVTDDKALPAVIPNQPTFRRQFREVADGWIFESTTGGKAFVPKSEIWAMVELAEPLLKQIDSAPK